MARHFNKQSLPEENARLIQLVAELQKEIEELRGQLKKLEKEKPKQKEREEAKDT